MASFRKKGRVWYYRFTDADGVQAGATRLPRPPGDGGDGPCSETEAARTRAGLTDPRELAYQRHAAAPLSGHLRGFESFLLGKGDTPKHAKLYSDRARRVAALACGGRLADFDPPKTASMAERERTTAALDRVLDAGRLADLSPSKVQDALSTLRASGRGLQTLAFPTICPPEGTGQGGS